MNNSSRLLGLAFASAMLAVSATGTVALAQAGSTGGTVGKQGKSVSGGEATDELRRPSSQKKHRRPKSISGGEETPPPRRSALAPKTSTTRPANANPREAASYACGKIVGTWSSWASGMFGKGDTVFFANGTITHPSSKGRWSCSSGEYVLFYDSFGQAGPYKLSPDGKQLIKISDGSASYNR